MRRIPKGRVEGPPAVSVGTGEDGLSLWVAACAAVERWRVEGQSIGWQA